MLVSRRSGIRKEGHVTTWNHSASLGSLFLQQTAYALPRMKQCLKGDIFQHATVLVAAM